MKNLGKETETLEFKKTTGEMKAAMISIASILNKNIIFWRKTKWRCGRTGCVRIFIEGYIQSGI